MQISETSSCISVPGRRAGRLGSSLLLLLLLRGDHRAGRLGGGGAMGRQMLGCSSWSRPSAVHSLWAQQPASQTLVPAYLESFCGFPDPSSPGSQMTETKRILK